MPYDEQEQKRKRSLHYSTGEGAFMAASNTITETFAVPYALALRASSFEIGLLSSLKSMADVLAQLPGAKIVDHVNRKNVCLLSMLLSKLLWLPIIILPIFFGNAVLILISLFTLSVFFQSLRRPAWTSIMGDLVKNEERGRYFAKRNVVTGFTSLLATVITGLVLTVVGFGLIFAASVMLGLAAFFMFMQLNEPFFQKNFYYKRTFSFSPRNAVNFFRINRNFSNFTFYMFFVSFATDISAAFIAVYILANLSISYEMFAIAVAVGMLSRILAQRYWGYFNDKYGSRKVLGVCGVLMIFVPLFYVLSSNIIHILLVRIFDGVVWAGMDLAAFNFLLGVTPSDKRPNFVANHNLLVGIGSMVGALLGGIFVETFTASPFRGIDAIQLLFVVSFVLRIISISLLKFLKDSEFRPESSKYIVLNPLASDMRKTMHHSVEFAIHSSWRAREFTESLEATIKEKKQKYVYDVKTKEKKRVYERPEKYREKDK